MQRLFLCGFQKSVDAGIVTPVPVVITAGSTFSAVFKKIQPDHLFEAAVVKLHLDAGTTTATQLDIILQDSDDIAGPFVNTESCKCGDPLVGKAHGAGVATDCIPLIGPPGVDTEGRIIEWHIPLKSARTYWRLDIQVDGDVGILNSEIQYYDLRSVGPIEDPYTAWKTP